MSEYVTVTVTQVPDNVEVLATQTRDVVSVEVYDGPAGPAGPPGPNSISTSTTTALNGLLKGNGSNVAVATAGTDYANPGEFKSADFTAVAGGKYTVASGGTVTVNAPTSGTDGDEIEIYVRTGSVLISPAFISVTQGQTIRRVYYNGGWANSIYTPSSGVNTGDETDTTIKDKLGITVLSGSNTGDQTDITGNAATATALQTARNIGGSSFDGTADIEIDRAKATSSAGGTLQNLSGTTCFSWGAGSGQNITIPTGTGVSFNSTSYTFGTGSAAAFNTALGLTTLATTTPGTGVATWLATPSGANLASALTTALPASKGGTGLTALGTGVATALGVNVGSAGAFVTFNGAGGTPSSITLTNGTSLPISTGVSGLGTGVATMLATFSSANIRTACTDETGTGSLVFADAPTFATSITVSGSNATGVIVASTSSAAGSISVASLMAASSTGDVYFSVGKALTNTNSALIGYSTTGATAPYAFMTTYGRAASDLCVNTNGSVGMGTATPSTKAKLEISSTTQGFLPPRMTTTQRDAITSPPAGLMIYNTTTNKLNVYTTAWEAVISA